MNKVFSLFLLLFSTSVFAWTIGPMNYQGRLLDNAGVPVTGSYNFKVRIYDAASGGTLKFSEDQNNIAVDDGVYSFLVSTGTNSTGAWDIALWNTLQLFMEIEVNGETLSPRHRMAAAPYAFQANLALTTNNALALGGKPIEWFDSTLEAICVAGKGKWLELANQGAGACLGAAASYPGPSMVSVSTLTASTDFTHLDLTNADISGIDFGSVDFSDSLLKSVTVNAAGIDNVSFSNAVLEGVQTTGSTTPFYANLQGAKLSLMDMSKWSLANANMMESSAGQLSACPDALPAGYVCKYASSPLGYVLLGPSVNISSESLLNQKLNPSHIQNSEWFFSDVTLDDSNFSGNDLSSLKFSSAAELSGAQFQQANITDVVFGGNMANTSFNGAQIKSSEFSVVNFVPSASFVGADLSFVLFNSISDNSVLDFTGAILANTEIRGSGIPGYGQHMSLNFNKSRIATLAVSANLDSLTIVNSTVTGGLFLPPYAAIPVLNIGGTWGGNATTFLGGNLSGNFTNANFAFSVFYDVSFRGANLTGSTGTYPSSYLNVDWYGAVCPDGFYVTTQGGTCIGHGINY